MPAIFNVTVIQICTANLTKPKQGESASLFQTCRKYKQQVACLNTNKTHDVGGWLKVALSDLLGGQHHYSNLVEHE